jgi:hypothetical protein
LKASQARLANDPWGTAPRTGPRTERTDNLALHYVEREQPMALLTHELTRAYDGPPIVSITMGGGPGTGRPRSIAPISVEIPSVVNCPECSLAHEFGLKRTLNSESFAGLVSKLSVLDPSIGQELNSLSANYNEETHAATEEAIARMIEPEINTFFKYGVGPQDLEWQSPDNRSRTVQSGWRVQDVPGKPCLQATIRGEETRVPNSSTSARMTAGMWGARPI